MEYTFRLAQEADRDGIIAFVRQHWEARHALVELPDFFDYYYKEENGRLRFALAEAEGRTAALAGYVPANGRPKPDVWVSLWVADPTCRGSGLALMAELPRLTGCRTLACNNIRPKTMAFYNFLGYATGRVGHFYRPAAVGEYRIAKLAGRSIPPAGGRAALTLLADEAALFASGFSPPEGANPYKDTAYIIKRYFHFPRQPYQLYAAALPGDTAPRALLAVRRASALGSAALRLVDYIGPAQFLPELGHAIDGLLRESGAEYADLYCVGLPPELLQKTGFIERTENSLDVIPNYLDPPLMENIEFYYFTSRPEGFMLFRADGDQDRPNISLE